MIGFCSSCGRLAGLTKTVICGHTRKLCDRCLDSGYRVEQMIEPYHYNRAEKAKMIAQLEGKTNWKGGENG